jgi:hypothetical protein
MPRFPLRYAAAALAFVLPALVRAQPLPSAPKSGYGTDDVQIVTVPMTKFLPPWSTTGYTTVCCISGSGERWVTGDDGNELVAAIDAGVIPNGAELTEFAFYFVDDNDEFGGEFFGYLCRSWVDAATGLDAAGDCPFGVQSQGVTGATVLSTAPMSRVFYEQDMDGDGDMDMVSYHLYANFGRTDGSIRLRMARMLFRRQVSPAPAAATFNDVPTSHPFFQFVEALAASGITAGCGTAIYCPDQPLTRGQMAVFLAKALGLHWPATAP